MDMSSLITTLLSSDSVSGVSKATKASSSNVQSVLNAALPLLLNGAKAQSEDESTAESFANALLSHGQKDTSNLTSFLKNVDLEDGGKIVKHLLGSTDSVEEIAKESGVSAKETGNILSAAAPLLMSLLGQDSASKKNNNTAAVLSVASVLLQNVDVGDLLGNLLGGGSSKTKKKTTAKKSTSSSKKTTTAKKTTAAKKTTKKADDDNDSAAEVIGDILGKLLK